MQYVFGLARADLQGCRLKPKKGAQSETGIESHDIGSYWSLSLDDDESIDSIPFIVSRGLIMRESLQIPATECTFLVWYFEYVIHDRVSCARQRDGTFQ